MYKLYAALSVLFLILTAALPASAQMMTSSLFSTPGGDTSQIYIDKNGNGLFEDVEVYQTTGTWYFVRLNWGQSFIRGGVYTNSSTKIMRLDGQPIGATDIQNGDLINVAGTLEENGSSVLSINASSIRDLSIKQHTTTFSGTVSALGSDGQSFTLTGASGSIQVEVGTSTIYKGDITIPLSGVSVGDTITKATGIYDPTTTTLQASQIRVYVNMALFKPQLFIGSLVSVGSDGSLQVTVGSKIYTIRPASGGRIINKSYSPTSISRFIAGDTIRIWGSIDESNYSIIDAGVIRDASL